MLGLVMAASLVFPGRAQSPQVGDVAFANSGASAAQSSFLYGLAQLHNFEYDEAARAFRDAQQHDPDFALSYWGEAMTKNHPVWMEQDLGAARRILERLGPSAAARIARGKTERERAYLRAIEALYGPGTKPVRDVLYLDDMRRIHAAYPDDIDATAFFGLALLGSAHEGRDTIVYMQAAAALEDAFAAHQNHPGLAHYLIHSYDDPVHAPLGLRAARRYSVIAPAAPHALHMTTHIYLATGMWDEVVGENERAIAVGADRARSAGRRPPACGHYNAWLEYGYLQQGRHADARRMLDACRATATGPNGLSIRSPDEDPLDPDNSPAGSYIQMWSRYLIDTGEWDASIANEDIPLGDLAGAKLTRAFVRALGAAKRGDAAGTRLHVAAVRQARKELETVLATRRDGAEQYRRRAAVLELETRAFTLLAEHQQDQAVAALREAAAAQDAMPIEFGPPFIDKPAPELLGDALLASNRGDEAVAAYRSALRQTPNRTAGLLGLARAASRANDAGTAADAFARLQQIWHRADEVPDEVKAARRF
jgi:tetratricopeptide (TPR) repeat protein